MSGVLFRWCEVSVVRCVLVREVCYVGNGFWVFGLLFDYLCDGSIGVLDFGVDDLGDLVLCVV